MSVRSVSFTLSGQQPRRLDGLLRQSLVFATRDFRIRRGALLCRRQRVSSPLRPQPFLLSMLGGLNQPTPYASHSLAIGFRRVGRVGPDENIGGNLKKHLKALNKRMKESATNLEFEEAAKIRDEIRKLEASELEITLNPKVKKYSSKNKIYPKGRSTMGLPGREMGRRGWARCPLPRLPLRARRRPRAARRLRTARVLRAAQARRPMRWLRAACATAQS